MVKGPKVLSLTTKAKAKDKTSLSFASHKLVMNNYLHIYFVIPISLYIYQSAGFVKNTDSLHLQACILQDSALRCLRIHQMAAARQTKNNFILVLIPTCTCTSVQFCDTHSLLVHVTG